METSQAAVPLLRDQLNRELYEKCESFIEDVERLISEHSCDLRGYDRPRWSYSRRLAELYYYLTFNEHEDIGMKDWIHRELAEIAEKNISPSDIEKLATSFDEFKTESVRRVIKTCEESPGMPLIDFIDKRVLEEALDWWNHVLYKVSKETYEDYCLDEDPCPWSDEYFTRQDAARYLRRLTEDIQDKNTKTSTIMWNMIVSDYARIVSYTEEVFGHVVPYVIDLFDKGRLFNVLYRESVLLASRMFGISREEAESIVDAYLDLPSHMPSHVDVCDC